MEKGVPQNFAKFTGNSAPDETPVNFAKFLRTTFLENNSRRLLLKCGHCNKDSERNRLSLLQRGGCSDYSFG